MTERKNSVIQKDHRSYTPDKSTHVQRRHKDTLFRYIFRDKKKLLQLYNAINESSYEDTDGLIVTTLENVIYIGYKNDISFLLDWTMYLMEHQSTWNPNIPLRGFLYFARLYRGFVETGEYNLYSARQIPLPFPQYIVFYNGEEERPEREVLKLSDAFKKQSAGENVIPALECRAVVLNINYGKNRDLMEKCKPLLDYSHFIYYIRENISKGCTPETAVNLAVEKSLEEDILTDELKAHRKEVVGMFLDEYDDEIFTRRMWRDIEKEARETGWEKGLKEGHEEGLKEGHEEGLKQGREKGLKEGHEEGLKQGHEEGLKEGHEEGLKEGLEKGLQQGLQEGMQEGAAQMGLLIMRLMESGRQDDISRAAKDEVFRKQLFEEFGL